MQQTHTLGLLDTFIRGSWRQRRPGHEYDRQPLREMIEEEKLGFLTDVPLNTSADQLIATIVQFIAKEDKVPVSDVHVYKAYILLPHLWLPTPLRRDMTAADVVGYCTIQGVKPAYIWVFLDISIHPSAITNPAALALPPVHQPRLPLMTGAPWLYHQYPPLGPAHLPQAHAPPAAAAAAAHAVPNPVLEARAEAPASAAAFPDPSLAASADSTCFGIGAVVDNCYTSRSTAGAGDTRATAAGGDAAGSDAVAANGRVRKRGRAGSAAAPAVQSADNLPRMTRRQRKVLQQQQQGQAEAEAAAADGGAGIGVAHGNRAVGADAAECDATHDTAAAAAKKVEKVLAAGMELVAAVAAPALVAAAVGGGAAAVDNFEVDNAAVAVPIQQAAVGGMYMRTRSAKAAATARAVGLAAVAGAQHVINPASGHDGQQLRCAEDGTFDAELPAGKPQKARSSPSSSANGVPRAQVKMLCGGRLGMLDLATWNVRCLCKQCQKATANGSADSAGFFKTCSAWEAHCGLDRSRNWKLTCHAAVDGPKGKPVQGPCMRIWLNQHRVELPTKRRASLRLTPNSKKTRTQPEAEAMS